MAVLLAMISVALVNFTGVDDVVGLWAAFSYTVIALAATAYAGWRYAFRIMALRGRRSVEYHDSYGPAGLCVALVVALVLNLALRVREL